MGSEDAAEAQEATPLPIVPLAHKTGLPSCEVRKDFHDLPLEAFAIARARHDEPQKHAPLQAQDVAQVEDGDADVAKEGPKDAPMVAKGAAVAPDVQRDHGSCADTVVGAAKPTLAAFQGSEWKRISSEPSLLFPPFSEVKSTSPPEEPQVEPERATVGRRTSMGGLAW